MKQVFVELAVAAAVIFTTGPALAQQELDPNALKLNPASYKNSYVKLKDIFIHARAGVPVALTKAGYTSQKYLTFGARNAGMRCFMTRDSVNEDILAQFKGGDPITIIGYVKQPKATVGGDTRFKHKEKLDIYIIEATKVEKGWE